jgi:hypothetical protein
MTHNEHSESGDVNAPSAFLKYRISRIACHVDQVFLLEIIYGSTGNTISSRKVFKLSDKSFGRDGCILNGFL